MPSYLFSGCYISSLKQRSNSGQQRHPTLWTRGLELGHFCMCVSPIASCDLKQLKQYLVPQFLIVLNPGGNIAVPIAIEIKE